MEADGTPDSPAEEQAIDRRVERRWASTARRRPIRCTPHMGTVDAARDMDIARAVVQDEAFNFLGKSYGTMLGATYAELFPERVGRMVLDGALPAEPGHRRDEQGTGRGRSRWRCGTSSRTASPMTTAR